MEVLELLLPYQKNWINDTSEVKIWEKSRRIGASYVEALDSVLEASKSKEAGGQSTYYLSYSKEMTRQFAKDCAFWAKQIKGVAEAFISEELVMKDEDKDITVYRLKFASGYEIWCLPSVSRSLRSKQGRVIIDEAAFVDDLADLLKAALALLMWGGRVSILSTHNGDDNLFNELIKDIRSGKKNYSLHHTTIDEALEQGLYKQICLVKGSDWSPEAEALWLEDLLKTFGEFADEELYCIPVKSGSKYLPRTLVERAMKKDIPVFTYEQTDDFTFQAESIRLADTMEWIADSGLAARLAESKLAAAEEHRNVRSYIGKDFARSGDLSVQAPFVEGKDLSLNAICYIELRNVPFQQQFQIFCYVADHIPGFSCAAIDARGNGQMIAELAAQKYGKAYVHQVMITRNFYMEYMPKYKAKFEDDMITLPQNSGVLDDHRTVVIEKGVPVIAERTSDGKNREGKKQLRHGDSVIAGVLGVYAQNNDDNTYQPYKYESVGTGNRWRSRNEEW